MDIDDGRRRHMLTPPGSLDALQLVKAPIEATLEGNLVSSESRQDVRATCVPDHRRRYTAAELLLGGALADARVIVASGASGEDIVQRLRSSGVRHVDAVADRFEDLEWELRFPRIE